MNFRMIVFIIGRLFLLLGIIMCVPLLVSVICADGLWLSFLIPIGGLLLLGGAMSFKKPQDTKIFVKEGFVIVAFSWILMALIGALPFRISGEIPNYVDAFFEITSGFTTTGASILSNVETLSASLAFWRCQSIWIGGMGVLVFLLAVMPKVDDNMQSMHIFRAESPGPQVGKITSKLASTSRILYAIYVALTLTEMLLLLCGGLTFFESITCAMSTAGTGGFYIYNASIGHFGSVYVEMVVATFMLLFGVNFTIYYLLLIRQFSHALKSEELRWYLGIVLFSTFAITLSLTLNKFHDFATSLRYSYFQVASIISTTGFTTTDFALWPVFTHSLLLLLMFIGASAGSTGGGIKVARFVLLGKTARNNLQKMISPNSVSAVRFEGKTLETSTVNSVTTYFLFYIGIITATTVLLSLDGFDFITNFSATVACLNNIGPGLSVVGPTGNYGGFSVFSKMILSVVMIAGRLELFPIIMLCYRRTWRNV